MVLYTALDVLQLQSWSAKLTILLSALSLPFHALQLDQEQE